MVMLRISWGLRPSVRRLERVRRSVLRRELIVVSCCDCEKWKDGLDCRDGFNSIQFNAFMFVVIEIQ